MMFRKDNTMNHFYSTNYDDGIPKHRKRKKKKVKKSDHKHEYNVDVLFKTKIESLNKYMYYYGNVCSLCGKIGMEKIFETYKEGDYYTVLTQEEILEKYKHLHIVGRD